MGRSQLKRKLCTYIEIPPGNTLRKFINYIGPSAGMHPMPCAIRCALTEDGVIDVNACMG
jgi:hypothetical protein